MNENLVKYIITVLKASAEMVNDAYARGSIVQNRYHYGKVVALLDVLVTADHTMEIETSVGEYRLKDVTEIYEVVESIKVDKKKVFGRKESHDGIQ